MPDLYRYPIISTAGPYGTTLRAIGDNIVEVADLDGYAYVAVNGSPPNQPEKIILEPVVLTDALRDALKTVSPQARLIARLVVERIRERYPIDEELYLARIGVGSMMGAYTLEPGEAERIGAYQEHVETCRAWGRRQYALLGLASLSE